MTLICIGCAGTTSHPVTGAVPTLGQRFDPHRYENICAGACVPAS